MTLSNTQHIPVLLNEVLTYLMPQDGKIYVDGTFGCGGYSNAILDKANCVVVGVDQDKNALPFAKELQKKYPERFHFIQNNFRELVKILEEVGASSVDGVILDLGVSSPQLDCKERGFSFSKEGPLDMRMGTGSMTAEEVLKTASMEKLADIFFYLGEERKARSIARAIVEKREKEKPLQTTLELAELVRRTVKGNTKIDPATRTFQALRIYVNDELGALHEVLEKIPLFLAPNAKVIIVTFHSLEDRLVKNSFKRITTLMHEDLPYFTLLTPKPIVASKEEIAKNPRARSAKLRAIKRTSIEIPQGFFEKIQQNQV